MIGLALGRALGALCVFAGVLVVLPEHPTVAVATLVVLVYAPVYSLVADHRTSARD